MRILLVKTSSLGDVIHNLPVASDIRRCFPDCRIDWCVEAPFAAIPRLHPAVGEVIPVAIRRWRRALFSRSTWQEFGAFRARIGATPYDQIIDTQGLVKSALLGRLAHGPRHGYDAASIREPLAARFYDQCHPVPTRLHAVHRNRQLAAQALGYADRLDELPLDYGLGATTRATADAPYAVLLTATSRDDKLWQEDNWNALGQRLADQGIQARLPAGNPVERARAERIATAIPGAAALPAQGLESLASQLAGATLVVGVDTGLTHLGVALARPTVALYVSTDPGLTGVLGAGDFRNLGAAGQPPSLAEAWDACTTLLGRPA